MTVLNLDLAFNWIGNSDRFLFERRTPQGDEYVLMDARTGTQSLVFEADALRRALAAACGAPDDDSPPRIIDLTVDADGARLTIDTTRGSFKWDAAAGACSALSPPLPADWVVSPDRRKAVARRGNDLWLHDLQAARERRLTDDGEANFAYGDINPAFDTSQVARRRAGAPAPLLGVLWSPDSRFVIALRQDLRPFPQRLHVAEYVPADAPDTLAHFRRVPLARDPVAPASKLVILDTLAGTVRSVQLAEQALNDYALLYFIGGMVWWAEGGKLFVLTANRGGARYALHCVELATGGAAEVIHEVAAFNVRLNAADYARPNVYVFSNAREAVWYSERSGCGHLYLYELPNGTVKRQLSAGAWTVFDLLHVDEARRLAYFTAASRMPGGDPYYRYLYRVGLDGGDPQLLTPEVADHRFNNFFFGSARRRAAAAGVGESGSSISPSGRYFVDSHSTVGRAPRYLVRKTSGELVAEFLQSDASGLYAWGWQPPQRVAVKAADGRTDLYAVITRPRGFDPEKKYPVIDYLYPGPQGSAAPRGFADQLLGGSIHHVQTYADAGFIIVTLDGRGTAYRSRAFREAFLGADDVLGLSDHVAALQGLAAQFPYLDLSRLGVMGQSFGGYAALRALLAHPQLFKAAVAATGPASWLDMAGQVSVERFFGVPCASPEALARYESLSNGRLAARLQGHALLIYGGIDQNVPLKHAFMLFDAFIKAQKHIDMLIVPDADHGVAREPYAIERSIKFFREHL